MNMNLAVVSSTYDNVWCKCDAIDRIYDVCLIKDFIFSFVIVCVVTFRDMFWLITCFQDFFSSIFYDERIFRFCLIASRIASQLKKFRGRFACLNERFNLIDFLIFKWSGDWLFSWQVFEFRHMKTFLKMN